MFWEYPRYVLFSSFRFDLTKLDKIMTELNNIFMKIRTFRGLLRKISSKIANIIPELIQFRPFHLILYQFGCSLAYYNVCVLLPYILFILHFAQGVLHRNNLLFSVLHTVKVFLPKYARYGVKFPVSRN